MSTVRPYENPEHPGKGTRQVSGARLGRDWSRWGIQRRLASDRARGVYKPTGPMREKLLAAVSSLERADGGMAMQVLGTTNGIDVTAADVTSMLEVCGRMDIRAMADFPLALRESMPPEERVRLRKAMELARALGHLPRERDLIDGVRSTYEERWARAGHAGDVDEIADATVRDARDVTHGNDGDRAVTAPQRQPRTR